MKQGLLQERRVQSGDLFVLATLPILKQGHFWGPWGVAEERPVPPEWLLFEEQEALWEPEVPQPRQYGKLIPYYLWDLMKLEERHK